MDQRNSPAEHGGSRRGHHETRGTRNNVQESQGFDVTRGDRLVPRQSQSWQHKGGKTFLDEYHSAAFNQDYVEEELFWRAVNGGIELESHPYTFDVDANPYLAELCPDGVSGQVSLLRFCGLFFVRFDQYGEGSEDFGPYPNLVQAKEAFEEVRWINET